MNSWKRQITIGLAALLVACSTVLVAMAQERAVVLVGAELTRVIPPGFYFQGQSAPTQMRNSAAARFGKTRYVIAGMVDTSGYSSDVRAKYEGFLITDSPIMLNGSELAVGAYGFGFSNDGKLNIMDLAGEQILSVSTTNERGLRRPRPLMMNKLGNEIRLYSGRQYVVIAAK
jgi:hypothetical protein